MNKFLLWIGLFALGAVLSYVISLFMPKPYDLYIGPHVFNGTMVTGAFLKVKQSVHSRLVLKVEIEGQEPFEASAEFNVADYRAEAENLLTDGYYYVPLTPIEDSDVGKKYRVTVTMDGKTRTFSGVFSSP